MDPARRRIETYFILALLLAAVLIPYQHAFRNGFVYDDVGYITRNYQIHPGLTVRGFSWALTTFHTANWHPVTWVSHMIDCGSYGPNPIGHHLSSVLLHLVNTLLLYTLLTVMTRLPWRSAFVAALFGAHPLHVESVAWISERKDVLSAFFGLLAILAYVAYLARPRALRYVAVLLLFALGLMSKPMLVTLPLVLLLLDYWPLGRIPSRPTASLLLEKTPLFVMSAASALVTILAQRANVAMASTNSLPFASRLANAAAAYVAYVRKMFCPSDLAVFYPHPLDGLSPYVIIGSVALLVGVTSAVLAARKRRYLLVGWMWYLITLLPVIGIVQVGGQAMADRYTYLPLVGLFIMIAWGLPEMVRGKRGHAVLAVGAVAATLALVALTRVQVRYWKDDFTLFSHAARLTRDNWVAHNQLACTLLERNKPRLALSHAREAVRIQSYNPHSHILLGLILTQLDQLEEAIAQFDLALLIDPKSALARACLADALRLKGNTDRAREEADMALKYDPENAVARDVLRKIARKTRLGE